MVPGPNSVEDIHDDVSCWVWVYDHRSRTKVVDLYNAFTASHAEGLSTSRPPQGYDPVAAVENQELHKTQLEFELLQAHSTYLH